MKFLFRTPLISFVLAPLLIGQPVWAQAPVSSAPDEAVEGGNLQLRAVNSDGSRIPAGSRSVKGFTIQVTDLHGVGVPEAAVAFRLPDNGASGVFPDGSHSAVVYTDSAGTAHVASIQWSETPGTTPIRITASKGNDHAGLLVEQTLVLPGGNPVTAPAEPARSAPLPPSPAVLQAAAPPAIPSVSVETVRGKGVLDSSYHPSGAEPSVSIVSSPESNSIGGGSKKKWIILGIVIAAGAGAGFAFANSKGNSASTAAAPSSISFGSPTVSVGHP